MKLSDHFTLEELTITQHREIDNRPTPEAVNRLRILCHGFLEPVRAKFGRLLITSGYRSSHLNRAIKGSSLKSAHLDGGAADFIPLDMEGTRLERVLTVARWVRDESGLPYDQVIAEHSSGDREAVWCHLGMNPVWRGVLAPRRQALRMERVGAGPTHYFPLE